jgi:DNA-binding NarL/FixJ family response regulator
MSSSTLLTPREQRLVRAIMRGGTTRDVAARLGIREQTVKNSLSRVYRKVGVRNRVELAMYGSQHLKEK